MPELFDYRDRVAAALASEDDLEAMIEAASGPYAIVFDVQAQRSVIVEFTPEEIAFDTVGT